MALAGGIEGMRTGLARLGVIAVLTVGLAGCQTIADLDPTGLLSEDTSTPDLAGIPNAPAVPDTDRDVASSLTAAGVQAQYSADALRAGTEAAAPAPGAAQPMSPQVAQALAAPPTSNSTAANDAPPSAAAPSAAAPSAAPPPVASNLPPSAAAPAPIPVQGNAVAAVAPPPAPIPVAGNAAPAAQMASAAPVSRAVPPPPGAEPAVPAVPPAGAIRSTIMAPPVVSDAALGFKPSAAPALDPSVSNFVSAPILSRYRQTAARSGSGGVAAVAAVPGAASSGSVITNLDAQPTSAVAAIAARNGGVPPTAVVYFPGDGTALSAAARTQVRAAAAAFKAAGGTGTIRVVGHASSRTPNMSVERHLQVIFEKSQGRANAVARELMNQGVPADRVRIDAVGDSQPVYYESMPRGEEGNRRAEIYLQG
jgi:outer membrane protein OmpA-like peptidoglycan-associated protein